MISVCIVTLNTRKYLKRCLDSLPKAFGSLNFEIIIIDNASNDGTIDLIKECYPNVVYLKNNKNLGYTIPMNQAISIAKGDYILQLNPDTELDANSISIQIEYMEKNEDVGICIPKIIDGNGDFQKSSRRGVPTPWATISYFLGLSRLLSENVFFTKYRLEHLDENTICEVDAVSGSCMLIKREVIDQIGMLDEKFFAYQEDSDFCFRAKKANWKILYNPASKITHFTGKGGSKTFPILSLFEWHRSYYYLYKKHLSNNYSKIFNLLYAFIMIIKLLISTSIYLLRR